VLLPEKVRRSKRAKSFKSLLSRNLIYDSEYFERDVEGPAVASVAAISRSIERDLAPSRIVDVGCGTGALLAAMRERGCIVMGLEFADTAIAYCRKRGVPVRKFNIERDSFQSDTRFDTVISMEVAEHLPERTADRDVNLLTALADVAVFTAATPNQGGMDHVNEQPHNY
jgi:2-polyprenyl-3-methyl-5-hydroxy-6-metoxy-1,4-benzoquinol methylase